MVVLVTCKNKEETVQMKELEWSQAFPIITLCELSVAMETRVLIRSSPKPNAVNLHTPIMLQMKFDSDWLAGLRDIHV